MLTQTNIANFQHDGTPTEITLEGWTAIRTRRITGTVNGQYAEVFQVGRGLTIYFTDGDGDLDFVEDLDTATKLRDMINQAEDFHGIWQPGAPAVVA